MAHDIGAGTNLERLARSVVGGASGAALGVIVTREAGDRVAVIADGACEWRGTVDEWQRAICAAMLSEPAVMAQLASSDAIRGSKPKGAESYERPDCWRLTREQLLNGTAEDFTRWRAEAAPVQERNAVRVRARCDAKREIDALVALAWPRGSEGFKVMTRALAKARVEGAQDFVRMLNDLEKDSARRREETTRKATQDAERSRKLLAAGAFLSARGKVIGVDYEAQSAIEVANDIAFDEAIAAQKRGGGFVSFGGDDNCEGCSGWDMTSHRCECGNRRVSWEHDGDFESMYVYAQAN